MMHMRLKLAQVNPAPPPMGWVECFATDYDDGSAASVFKIIGETEGIDVGVDHATESAVDLHNNFVERALWGKSVVGVKASYDGVHRVVVYLDAHVASVGVAVDEVIAAARQWGAHSLRIGKSDVRNSPIIRYV